MSTTAYAKRSAPLSALLNTQEVRNFLRKPVSETRPVSIAKPAPKQMKNFLEDAHALFTTYRENPQLLENLSQGNRQTFYDRYCVWYNAETCPHGLRFEGDGGPDFDQEEYQSQPNYAISFIHWGVSVQKKAKREQFIKLLNLVCT